MGQIDTVDGVFFGFCTGEGGWRETDGVERDVAESPCRW